MINLYWGWLICGFTTFVLMVLYQHKWWLNPHKTSFTEGTMSSSSTLGKGRASTVGANRTTPRSLKCTILKQHRTGGLPWINKHRMGDIQSEQQFSHSGYHEKNANNGKMMIVHKCIYKQTNKQTMYLYIYIYTWLRIKRNQTIKNRPFWYSIVRIHVFYAYVLFE